MTGLDLDAISARAAAATEGPWAAYDSNEGTWPPRPGWSVANDAFHNPPADEDAPWLAVDLHVGQAADAEFIAASRTDVPALVAEVQRLREMRRRVTALHCWTNEDGKRFVFADDLLEAVDGLAAGGSDA